MNRKAILFFLSISLLVAACGTLTSTTTIEARKSFVLGNNTHGVFSVRLKNVSQTNVVLHHAPITGGRHSFETVKPGEVIRVKVERDTALVIENQSEGQVSVELFVTGDTGLSMEYKK